MLEASRQKRRTVHTSGSNTPSPVNPSYMELLEMTISLPTEPIFLPTADLRVYDTHSSSIAR